MSEIIKKTVLILKRNINLIILAGSFYLGGIVIGVIYFLSKNSDASFFKQVLKYYNDIINCSVSPLSVFFTRFAIDIGYVAIIFLLSLTLYAYPLILLFIAYRGAIIGCAAGIFISVFGFNGIAVYFTVVLPQNLIVTAGLIVSAALNFDYIICKPINRKTDIGCIIKNCLIGLMICLIGAIYELFITVILIRPMNFYF